MNRKEEIEATMMNISTFLGGNFTKEELKNLIEREIKDLIVRLDLNN